MRRRVALLVAGAVGIAAVYAATVLAMPSSGFTATTLAKGRFGRDRCQELHTPRGLLAGQAQTQGESDLYVQSNVWVPGGTTGWRTHPGHSLIIVTAGTVTTYEGDDPDCTPHVYTPGMGFVDPGGRHVHLIRKRGNGRGADGGGPVGGG